MNKKLLLMVGALIVLLGIVVAVMKANKNPLQPIATEMTIEYGTEPTKKLEDYLDYTNLSKSKIADIQKNAKIKFNKQTNGYEVLIQYKKNTCTININEKDTIPPEFTKWSETIETRQTIKIDDYHQYFEATDLSGCTLTFDDSKVDYATVGEYSLLVKAKDHNGLEANKEATIRVTPKTRETIETNKEMTVGETINFAQKAKIKTDDITYTSSNDKIVKVNKGKIEATGTGKADITVSFNQDEYIEIWHIQVKEKEVKQPTPAAQTKPVETKPTVQSPQTKPTETKPTVQSQSTQTKPAQTKPVETKPAEPVDYVTNYAIASQTSQIIDVQASGSNATVSLHNKDNGVWKQVFSCSGRIGKNGITSSKQEGDGKTPAGVYSLGKCFGIASNPGCRRDYTQINDNHYWVDDSTSPYYNQFVDISTTPVQWNSAEHLIDYTSQYEYVIQINYNTNCTPGKGSAIFLHCLKSATIGCVAIPTAQMVSIMQNLRSDTLIYIH